MPERLELLVKEETKAAVLELFILVHSHIVSIHVIVNPLWLLLLFYHRKCLRLFIDHSRLTLKVASGSDVEETSDGRMGRGQY